MFRRGLLGEPLCHDVRRLAPAENVAGGVVTGFARPGRLWKMYTMVLPMRFTTLLKVFPSTVLLLGACGDAGGGSTDAAASAGDGGANVDAFANTGPDAAPPVPIFTELWYAVDDRLVRIVLDTADGSVVELVQTPLEGMHVGHNCLTMLDDGTLLGARLSDADDLTYLFHIATPPRNGV